MNYKIKVNEQEFSFEEKIVTGINILEKAGFLPVDDFDLYKKNTGQEYEPIQNNETVDLSEPGIEKFRVLARKELSFEVDDEEYKTNKITLTPLEIFEIINKNHLNFYLKQLLEHMEISYKQDEDKLIDMVGRPRFITCKKEPTTVS